MFNKLGEVLENFANFIITNDEFITHCKNSR